MKYRDPVIEITGRMPFAGKHAVKFLFEKGIEGGKKGKRAQKVGNVAALGLLGAIHAVQLKMGLSELSHHGSQSATEVGIDVAYTIANGMAVYTQTALAGLALVSRKPRSDVHHLADPVLTGGGFISDNASPECMTENDETSQIKVGRITLGELAITLGGQFAFMATMHH